jgi:hypothetical protein
MILILLTLVLVGLFIGSVYVDINGGYEHGMSSFLCEMLFGGILFILILAWPINYMATISEVESFKATQTTLEIARTEEIDSLERIALQHKIIEQNQWLARVQYWNNTILDPMYPDKVEKLKPLN